MVQQEEYLDNDGTSYALWITVWLGVASTLSNVIVKYAMVSETSRCELRLNLTSSSPKPHLILT